MDAQLNDEVIVKRKEKCIQLLHPENYDYHHILREKLNWS
jgi:NAD+ kinase